MTAPERCILDAALRRPTQGGDCNFQDTGTHATAQPENGRYNNVEEYLIWLAPTVATFALP